MGWFSRSQSEHDTGFRTGPRTPQSAEAQVREMRQRARHRLIGALALVLAAVIVVPMAFDSGPEPEEMPVPVVMQGFGVPETSPSSGASTASSGTLSTQAPERANDLVSVDPSPGNTLQPTPQAGSPETSPPAPTVSVTPAPTPPAPAVASAPVKPPAPAPVPNPPKQRTDDGSVALALLEGRSPPRQQAPAATSERGNFILQIAAYGTEKDAQARRDRLVSSGVTNAYIEQSTAGGKTAYRLRVGPFPTRDAAQAAQARLRALGFDNGFISTK